MKNCTKHSIERWVERIVGISTKKERDDYIRDNGEQIKEHMNKSFEFSVFIFKGQIGDNITRNYYIVNDIVFVLNTTDDAIITVYKVDFNFTPEINLEVSKGLIKEIHKLASEKEEIEFQSLIEKEALESQFNQLNNQIEVMKQQIKILEESKKSVYECIKNMDNKAKIVDLEIQKYTSQLVNSKEYRDDLKAM